MHSSTLLNVALLSTAAVAKNIRINVGDGGLVFTPNSTTAAKGDVLQFFFSDSPHSVVAGDFNKACSPLSSNGFFSGVVTSKEGSSSVFEVTVKNTDPLFYYCSVGRHCEGGMVGVINPGKDNTLEKYASAAADANSSGEPDSVSGGTVTSLSGSAASSSSAMSSSSSGTSSGSMTSASTTGSSDSSSSSGGSTAASKTTTDSSGSSGTATTTAAAQSTTSGAAGQFGPVLDGVLLGAAGVVAMLV